MTPLFDDSPLVVTPFSRITPEKMSWLWKGYIPRTGLTLIEGPPKQGKSTVLTDLAARVSSGLGTWPDGQPIERPGAVLILSGEDSPARVIHPRLRVAGALLEAVHVIKAVDGEGRPRQFVIGSDDTARLEATILDTGAVLVIIDPLSIYMGETDSHREQEVRRTLWYLSELAERTGCAILCCRHWKKSKTGDALVQGGGSVGYAAAARSILSVNRAPDDKTARVLAVRTNYATVYPSLAFRLESVDAEDVARIKWEGVSRHDADDLAAEYKPTKRDGAEAFLEDRLPEDAAVVIREGSAAGYSEKTLRRAAEDMGVVHTKSPDGQRWRWSISGQGGHTRESGHLPRKPNNGAGHLPSNGDAFEDDLPAEGSQP